MFKVMGCRVNGIFFNPLTCPDCGLPFYVMGMGADRLEKDILDHRNSYHEVVRRRGTPPARFIVIRDPSYPGVEIFALTDMPDPSAIPKFGEYSPL